MVTTTSDALPPESGRAQNCEPSFISNDPTVVYTPEGKPYPKIPSQYPPRSTTTLPPIVLLPAVAVELNEIAAFVATVTVPKNSLQSPLI